jgi:4-hydroxy-2-oxoheptanedioate aldolase
MIGSSEQHPNPIREIVRAKRPLLLGFCSIPSALTAEVMAVQDVGAVGVDMQHGPIGIDCAAQMLMAIERAGKPAMCRVSGNTPHAIGSALDLGFDAIICPGINSAADAANFVRHCQYPPKGVRSFGATRAGLVYGAGYLDAADEYAVKLAMIESPDAAARVDEIVNVPGIDGIFVGPGEFALAMGLKPAQRKAERMAASIEHARRHAEAAGRIAGIFCDSAEMVGEMRHAGFHVVALAPDYRLYAGALAREVKLACS